MTATHPGSILRRRFTADDYERMAEAGILTEDDRVELIAGEIVEMSPVGHRHAGCVTALTDLLGERVGKAASISVQSPIRLANDSEPQPDITVLKRGRYHRALPTVADVLLVIEVADSSRDYDRAVKLPLYARAGLAEAWLVDLVAETVERHTAPQGGRYTQVARAKRGEALTSTVLPILTLAVDELLG